MADIEKRVSEIEHVLARLVTVVEKLVQLEVGDLPDDEPEDASSEDWQDFLTDHPELQKRQPLDLSEDAVLEALKVEIQQWCKRSQWFNPRDGIWSSLVAKRLAGFSSDEVAPAELRPSPGDVIRVGQRLRELTRRGLVECVSKPYAGTRRWAPVEGDDG
jgi:hypothetical protein